MFSNGLNHLVLPSPKYDKQLLSSLNIKCESILQGDKKHQKILQYFEGKRVLVTGGAGSIGSELCKRICLFNPESVHIFDINENNSYFLQLHLKKYFPNVKVQIHIGNICDKSRVSEVFESVKPQVVFHACAHKHVPLMEDSPKQAIKNNIFATLNLYAVADKFKVERFILISSDKAVHPVGVMGMTKRVCEMALEKFCKNSSTIFSAVRFGNVFASDGSAVLIFINQILEGGPLTLTSPDMNRYFISVTSACDLLLLTAVNATKGDIFMLDMGTPINLVTLANALIKRYGNANVKIEYVGVRKGEKLNEQLFYEKEITSTLKSDYYVCKPTEFDFEHFNLLLSNLKKSLSVRGKKGEKRALNLLQQLVNIGE